MLKSKLIHPEILHALGGAGHGSKILIADGNYPFSTGSNPEADKVFLNLAQGIVKVPQVLEVLTESVEVEEAGVMTPGPQSEEPPIFNQFRKLLSREELIKHGRFEFYEQARKKNVALTIATGETRTYANILLTIGVVH